METQVMRRLRDLVAVWKIYQALRQGEKAREEQRARWRADLCVCVVGDPERADRAWAVLLQPVND